MPPLTLVWYEGRKNAEKKRKGGQRVLPPEELQARFLKQGEQISGSGSVMVGDKGLAYSPDDYGGTIRFLPEKPKPPPATLPRNGKGDQGMKDEWLAAIQAKKPAIALSNFDYAALLTETILLGNVAMRVAGQKLEWDGPNLKFTNFSDANKYLHHEYRKGWTL
jgi:hypothetical protein